MTIEIKLYNALRNILELTAPMHSQEKAVQDKIDQVNNICSAAIGEAEE